MSLNANNSILLAAVCIKADLIPLVWGPPGVGKTATMPALAKSLGFLPIADDGDFYNREGFVSFAASYLSVEDMAGMPAKGDNGLLERLHDTHIKLAADTACLMNIDELNRATNTSVMNTLLRLCQERMAGPLCLHSGTAIIGTANPVTSDGAREIPPALANRVCHIEWQVDVNDFIDYLLGGVGVVCELPVWQEVTPAHHSEAKQLLAAFLRANPLKHYMLPGDELMTDKPWGRSVCGAWASWRSWENLTKVMAVILSLGDIRKGVYADLMYNLGLGIVGPVAGEFHNFLAKSDLRSGSEVLDGGTYTVPRRIDILWAECMSASIEARHRNTLAAWHAALGVYRAVIKSGFAEVPVICLPYLVGHLPKGGPGLSPVFTADLKNQPDIMKLFAAVQDLTKAYG